MGSSSSKMNAAEDLVKQLAKTLAPSFLRLKNAGKQYQLYFILQKNTKLSDCEILYFMEKIFDTLLFQYQKTQTAGVTFEELEIAKTILQFKTEVCVKIYESLLKKQAEIIKAIDEIEPPVVKTAGGKKRNKRAHARR